MSFIVQQLTPSFISREFGECCKVATANGWIMLSIKFLKFFVVSRKDDVGLIYLVFFFLIRRAWRIIMLHYIKQSL